MATNKFLIFQQQNQRENEKYKKKLKRMKYMIKNLIYENAALCDQVAQIQENILCVKEERRFLLKKLIEYENELESQQYGNTTVQYHNPNTSNAMNFNDFSSTPIKKIFKKRTNSEATSESSFKSRNGGNTETGMKKNTKALAKKSSFPNISLPISLNGFILHSLGEIIFDRPGYHSENCIYPIGYIITRAYIHLRDSEQKCQYTCKIVDNGDSPRFEIIPEVDTEFVISGPSPDYCHTTLLQLIHSSTDTRNTNIRPQGEWFFGLTDSVVADLILSHPNAQQCIKFKGFLPHGDTVKLENEANSVNIEALQKHLTVAAYHTVPEIKEEPPDELLDHSELNNFNVC